MKKFQELKISFLFYLFFKKNGKTKVLILLKVGFSFPVCIVFLFVCFPCSVDDCLVASNKAFSELSNKMSQILQYFATC